MKTMNSIKSIILIIFFLVIYTKILASVLQETSMNQENNDGPYIIYKKHKAKIINITYFNNRPKIVTDTCSLNLLVGKEIKVTPNSNMPAFTFKIFNFQPDSSHFKRPDKLLVVSDIEGNFEDFVEILVAAGVINNQYDWTYGSNHLLINGDLFDRGNDVMAFLWFCYKLDRESQLVGGKVHINLGNHDVMNLRGNISYAAPKYLYLDSILGINYKVLFNEETEIGRWLRTKNCVTIIDSNLFVHGGIYVNMITYNLTADSINLIIRENLGKEESQMSKIPKLLFGVNGPFWYRGLVFNIPKYRPVTDEYLDTTLKYFGVNRMIVGHCMVPEIMGLHNGKVIAVDVNHYKNKKGKKSRALLITDGQFFTINDEGKIKILSVINGFKEDIFTRKQE